MNKPFDIDQYLVEINREELLTLEQEQELIERIRQGDHSAATSLARAKRPFMVSLVAQYKNKGASLEELFATSNKALEQAALQYAQSASTDPFIKYAVPLIRQALENL